MNAILINLQEQGQEEKVRPQRRGGGGAWVGGRGVGILCNSPFRYTAVA